jgi:hypothetical protein
MANTCALFVRKKGIISTIVRKATQRTLLRWWLWGNIYVCYFIIYYCIILPTIHVYYFLTSLCREPLKKRPKIAKASKSSIVSCKDGAPTKMCFPPRLLILHLRSWLYEKLVPSYHSQNMETTTKKKGKYVNSSDGTSKRWSDSSSDFSSLLNLET